MRTRLLPLLCLAAGPALAQYGSGAALTYVAGQAAINGRPVAQQASVQVGQMLATGNGSAELALTPGVMLRMDKATAIKLVALDDHLTEVQVNSGRAEIDLAGMREGRELQVDTPGGVQTLLIRNGLYEFNAQDRTLRVFDGKAAVSSGGSNQWLDVKAGHQLALNGSSQPTEFDRNLGDGFASRQDSESARGGGYGYGPAYGFEGGDFGYPYTYGFGYPYGYGFYEPYGLGFYPGFYGGFGYYGGYGFGGYRGGFGGYRGGFGGYRGGFGGRGFRR